MGGRDNRSYGRLQQGRGMTYGNVGGANRLNARSGRAGNNALLRNNGSIVEMKTADSMQMEAI